eukprot:TRINITY_DN581_c0_g1_i3.p1 TRINITY_DN581_c0_g1~~TRINITY_DN581_c0_g1_i3.p1  ORF type:complete len:241 (-),score=-28.17 TRINITY_DN581_c0_g1_i3:17-739(-)
MKILTFQVNRIRQVLLYKGCKGSLYLFLCVFAFVQFYSISIQCANTEGVLFSQPQVNDHPVMKILTFQVNRIRQVLLYKGCKGSLYLFLRVFAFVQFYSISIQCANTEGVLFSQPQVNDHPVMKILTFQVNRIRQVLLYKGCKGSLYLFLCVFAFVQFYSISIQCTNTEGVLSSQPQVNDLRTLNTIQQLPERQDQIIPSENTVHVYQNIACEPIYLFLSCLPGRVGSCIIFRRSMTIRL